MQKVKSSPAIDLFFFHTDFTHRFSTFSVEKEIWLSRLQSSDYEIIRFYLSLPALSCLLLFLLPKKPLK